MIVADNETAVDLLYYEAIAKTVRDTLQRVAESTILDQYN